MPILQSPKFFFESSQPGCDKVKILETDPLSFFSCLSEHGQGSLILPTSHGQLQVIFPSDLRLAILFKFLGRIIASRYNKEGRNIAIAFFLGYLLNSHIRSTDTADAQHVANDVYEGQLKLFGTENVDQQHFLETGQSATTSRE